MPSPLQYFRRAGGDAAIHEQDCEALAEILRGHAREGIGHVQMAHHMTARPREDGR
jgi:hypothetical protein